MKRLRGQVALARGAGPHSARRSVVDIMGALNVHPQTAMGLTGHSSVEQLTNYRTVRDTEVQAVTVAIESAIFGAARESS